MDGKEVTKFCYCGLPLKVSFGVEFCEKHGLNFKAPIKAPKRVRFSGKSNTRDILND